MAKSKKKKTVPASVVWFDIAADDIKRAKAFYGKLFGWKVSRFPGSREYWHIDTGGPDSTIDGGMVARENPQHSVTNYINVESVDKSAKKVTKLGGQICMPKTAVPGMGYFAVCLDTEKNAFALWEMDEKAT